MFHGYFSFSIECALFEKLFFIVVFTSTNQRNLDLEKIAFEIYFSWNER